MVKGKFLCEHIVIIMYMYVATLSTVQIVKTWTSEGSVLLWRKLLYSPHLIRHVACSECAGAHDHS